MNRRRLLEPDIMQHSEGFYFLNNFVLNRKAEKNTTLGKGSFATVYLAQHKIDLQNYAIKTVL